jgi:hypothetical protein
MNLNYQNTEKGLRYLAAQKQIYNEARRFKNLSYVLVLFPILVPFCKQWLPELENWYAIVDIAILVLVNVFFDLWEKQKINTAARIQEEFDTDIYGISWNSVEADEKVSKETVIEAASRLESSKRPTTDWYNKDILTVREPTLQILLCQRENVAWEARLKKIASNYFLYAFLIVLGIAIFLFFQHHGMDNFQLVKDYILPCLPCLWLLWIGYKAFSESSKTFENVENKIVQFFENYKKTQTVPSEQELRSLQDRIIKSRKENTVIPEWLYYRFEKKLNQLTATASNDYIKEL